MFRVCYKCKMHRIATSTEYTQRNCVHAKKTPDIKSFVAWRKIESVRATMKKITHTNTIHINGSVPMRKRIDWERIYQLFMRFVIFTHSRTSDSGQHNFAHLASRDHHAKMNIEQCKRQQMRRREFVCVCVRVCLSRRRKKETKKNYKTIWNYTKIVKNSKLFYVSTAVMCVYLCMHMYVHRLVCFG